MSAFCQICHQPAQNETRATYNEEKEELFTKDPGIPMDRFKNPHAC